MQANFISEKAFPLIKNSCLSALEQKNLFFIFHVFSMKIFFSTDTQIYGPKITLK